MALHWLEENNGRTEQKFKEFYKLTKNDGRRWLWYARPRLIEKTCLNCHNKPEGKSPKKDLERRRLPALLRLTAIWITTSQPHAWVCAERLR